MNAMENDSPIGDDELLARFILFSKWIRTSSNTVRPEAFIPHPYPNLSVTRHIGLSEDEVWQIGQDVANVRPNAILNGRADLSALDIRNQTLQIHPDPLRNNRNHAHITNWPPEKPKQKSIAQELAAAAQYIPCTNPARH